MDIIRKNSEKNQTLMLINEMRTLRKGRGLTLWKLNAASQLRAVIAEHTGIDEEYLTADQIHTFVRNELEQLGDSLEARATRNAFGLDQTHTHLNLMQRRTTFAQQLNRHTDTIEIYENHGIEAVVNRLLNFNLSQDPKSHLSVISHDTGGDATEKMSKAARNMVVQGLSDIYSLGAHAPEILRSFGKGESPYLDATVKLALLPSNRGDKWYNYSLRYTFRTYKKHFRIGVVSTAHDCEILMASGLTDDVIKLNNQQDARSEIETILNNCRLSIHDTEKGTQESFRFLERDETLKRELLSSVWQIDPNKCFILEAELTEVANKPSIFYEYSWSFDMPISDEQYAYWYAPGLMYLNSITVDISHFPNRDKWNMYIQPFLGPIFPGALEPTKDRYTLAASGWIMQCHGVAIIWHKAE